MHADATQVFGGRALTATGMGKYIENVSAPLVLYFHFVWHMVNFLVATRGPACELWCVSSTDWMLLAWEY